MGLEASVMCTCLREGKTKPFAFPDLFYIDEDGFPSMDVDRATEEQIQVFYAWLRHCCEHPAMEFKGEYISNWEGYHAFLKALESLGEAQFPTLLSKLPQDNSGSMRAEDAAKALLEIEQFRAQAEVGRNLFVVNSDTNERLYAYVPEHQGVFVWDSSTGYNIGVDANGLFIADAWELERVLFRARRVEQTLLEPEITENGRGGRVQFTDLDSGRQMELKAAIPGKEIPWPDGRMRNNEGSFRLEYPRLIHVEEQILAPDYFEYILQPLEHIFQAAVQTGNPVRWT